MRRDEIRPIIPEVLQPMPVNQRAKQPLAVEMQQRIALNKVEVITAIGDGAFLAVLHARESAGRTLDQIRLEMERHDTTAAQLGPEVAETHRVSKINAGLLAYQRASRIEAAIDKVVSDTLDRLDLLPDAVFYSPSFMDRLRALLGDQSADLLLRPGTTPLTFMENVKELLGGGVIAKRAAEYDQAQIESRRQTRAILEASYRELPAHAAPVLGERSRETEAAEPSEEELREWIESLNLNKEVEWEEVNR